MNGQAIVRLASLKTAERFQEHLRALQANIPCDQRIITGENSPLRQPLTRDGLDIRNRIAVQPMEGWDGTADGNPTEATIRRWRRFGSSGAGLIWGGEAVAVSQEGRANPNQLVIAEHTLHGLAQLRKALIDEYQRTTDSIQTPLIGLQLTHSGRYCKPNSHSRNEPRIAFHHPILDKRLRLSDKYPLLADSEIRRIIEDFHRAALRVAELGFDFVDIKHCHGYLAHELLAGHTRGGDYGGSFENRTRFLREVVEGVRSLATKLEIGVRLSAFDSIPFQADPNESSDGKPGVGAPEKHPGLIPYRWGFGVSAENPAEMDLTETSRFLALLKELGIRLVNLTAGSPYYTPHIQRPALYPPSDGYLPPEDPLVGVARQMEATRRAKAQFPELILMGSAYSYLQEFLPQVAQAAVREGWVDLVGLGRMVLSYPEILWDATEARTLQRKRICRTFSDCTTAPRNGLPSGCFPLDSYYKNSKLAQRLNFAKGIKPRSPASEVVSKNVN
jgi:2,4-dienoyl-CoA reductase-like NADH-dependent reductase (Old Yellow Enzyme family)